MKDKFFRISVKVRNCKKVFAKGLPPGVIAQQTVRLPRCSKAMQAAALLTRGEELVAEVVAVEYEESK